MGANFDSRRMLRRGIEGGRVTGNEMLSRRAHRRMYMLASKVCGLASLGATGFCEYELFLLLCLFSPVSLHVHTRSREWTPNATAKMAISSVDYTDFNLHWGLGVVRHWRKAQKKTQDDTITRISQALQYEPCDIIHILHSALSNLLFVHTEGLYSKFSGEFDRSSLLRTLVRQLNHFNDARRLLPLHLLLCASSDRSSEILEQIHIRTRLFRRPPIATKSEVKSALIVIADTMAAISHRLGSGKRILT